jgi:predicted outer membrane repeat protein
MKTQLLILLLLPVVSVCGKTIHVAHTPNATDTQECWKDRGPPCKTLNYAFGGVTSNTALLLGSGTFRLKGNTILKNVQNVAISAANDSKASAILCEFDDPGGLKFEGCSNLTLGGFIDIINCGILQNTTCNYDNVSTILAPTAVYFNNCTDVSLVHVAVRDSNGTGVTMYSVVGKVTIQDSTFAGNKVHNASEWASGGTGLYIEFPYCPPGVIGCDPQLEDTGAEYSIESCVFSENNASVVDKYAHALSVENGTRHVSFGRGGGLSVYFAGKAYSNNIQILYSNFTSNTAVWGGGLFVQFQDNAHDNHFYAEGCQVKGNSLPYDVNKKMGTGGGGARLGYVFYESTPVTANSMEFNTCTFNNNQAYWGGGVSYVVPREDSQSATNTLRFVTCFWIDNTARLGSAVDLDDYHPILTGSLAPVVFENCSFLHNSYYYYVEDNHLIAWQYLLGRGAVYTDSVPISFRDTNYFYNCSGTAVASFNAPVYFEESSESGFWRNYGVEGGAIALIGAAVMVAGENSSFLFKNNYADRLGGAIYAVNLAGHQLVASRNCFLRYSDSMLHPSQWKVNFTFENNSAEVAGQSIYTTSLLPCLFGVFGDSLNTSLNANKIAFRWSPTFQYNNCPTDNFTVEWNCSSDQIASDLSEVDLNDEQQVVSVNTTTPQRITFSLNEPIVKFAPGNFTPLPFDLHDDLDNEVNTVFYARINCGTLLYGDNHTDCGVRVNDITTYVSDLTVALVGDPVGNTDDPDPTKLPILTLNSMGSLEYQLCVRVNLTCCPPGFLHDSEKCLCADSGQNKVENIVSCDMNSYIAYLKSNHWVGYFDTNHHYSSSKKCAERILYSSICPPGYCKVNPKSKATGEYGVVPLRVEASNGQLSEILCDNRTGELCGECKPGYSVAINDIGNGASCIICNDNIHTSLAWLVWLVMEILPITLLVVAFLVFDFKILKGPLNSFMLYAQVVEFFGLYAFGELNLLRESKWAFLIKLYRCFYGFWNLQFLSAFLPPFCLAEGMTTFHIYMIKYAIALYPFVLLVTFYLCRGCIARIPLCNRVIIRIQQIFIRWQRLWKSRSNVLNGLAALMVLSYSKITAISFTILASTSLVNGDETISVVRFQGTLRPFQYGHIPFAIIAMLFISTVISIVPFLLIFHPLLPILYEKGKLKRYRIFARLNKWSNRFLVTGFLPPFQGCYEEKMAFFAGVMFIARIAFLAAFASTGNVETLLTWNTLISLCLLILHSTCQPYQARLVNVLDAVIYSIMVFINVLSLYSLYVFNKSGEISVVAFYCQLFLIYCPLLYLVGWAGYSIFHAFTKCYRSGKEYHRANSYSKSRVLSRESLTESSVTTTRGSHATHGQHLMRDELLDYDYESSGSFWEREHLVQSKSRDSQGKSYNSINTDGEGVSESVMAIHD